MNILDKIIAQKRIEVATQKTKVPLAELEKSEHIARKTYSLKQFITNPSLTGIIAEFKRQSPSKGIINNTATVEQVTTGYANAGASALSILTDSEFFGGSSNDVINARAVNKIPILRKEFIIDLYQIVEAKAIGADAILLIAAVLTHDEIISFSSLANALGLEVLLELHAVEELEKVVGNIDCIGINNRNLKDFKVDIEHSKRMAAQLPENIVKVAESGIDNVEVIADLKNAGFQGFLMGEFFMKQSNPALAFEEFISKLKK